MELGQLLRELRLTMRLSQPDLAKELKRLSGRDTVTRNHISRWESGGTTPIDWLPHLAMALQVPWQVLEDARLHRRTFLMDIAAFGLTPMLPAQIRDVATELFTSIAGGDSSPLATVQTSHVTDLNIAHQVAGDRFTSPRLMRWMDDANSAVIRVNAAGILAKTRDPEHADLVVQALVRDRDSRELYLRAVSARVGTGLADLVRELSNPRDAGARWCSAILLSQHHSESSRQALIAALRSEPSREIIRSIALSLNGDPQWS
ncbi:helix-turn-helix domain-containing protein [Nonomuraea sp. NPDC050556]|uniref:helix-turn-helix domain-containing protein n=1 Tax=Nonomuraea sp. NPDC050556 TaxID=3364369 RepID=UPI0037B43FC8